MPDASLNAERVIIKTADISMEVKRVEESVQSFQYLVNSMHGHVFHYEIQNDKFIQNQVQQTLDSSLVLSEVHPAGMMKVRIPAQYGDTFISAVLIMDGSIASFMFDENDVTEDITEKKELMLSDAGISGRKHTPKNVDEHVFEKETRESFIKRKANFSKMNYQTKNLWFDIHLKGNPFTNKQMIAKAEPIHTPFYVRAAAALYNGWYGLSLFITLLLNFWPLFIAALLILIVMRKYFPQVGNSGIQIPNSKSGN